MVADVTDDQHEIQPITHVLVCMSGPMVTDVTDDQHEIQPIKHVLVCMSGPMAEAAVTDDTSKLLETEAKTPHKNDFQTNPNR